MIICRFQEFRRYREILIPLKPCRFSVTIDSIDASGMNITITRTDNNAGWAQDPVLTVVLRDAITRK